MGAVVLVNTVQSDRIEGHHLYEGVVQKSAVHPDQIADNQGVGVDYVEVIDFIAVLVYHGGPGFEDSFYERDAAVNYKFHLSIISFM